VRPEDRERRSDSFQDTLAGPEAQASHQRNKHHHPDQPLVMRHIVGRQRRDEIGPNGVLKCRVRADRLTEQGCRRGRAGIR
jgi:hypothetical protein